MSDNRPDGWTELMALKFVGAHYSEHICEDSFERIEFVKLFLEGCWPEIQSQFPEFQTWIDKQHAETKRLNGITLALR